MKIFSAEQIKSADAFTIENEPISSIDLMERAGERITQRLLEIFPNTNEYVIFSGPGNNGGDGLVIARLLYGHHKNVKVYLLDTGKFTDELSENLEPLKQLNISVASISTTESIESIQISQESILVDALFGNGLSRPLEGVASDLVKHINTLPNVKVAVDVPSGLSADAKHVSTIQNTVTNHLTLSIQFPKLAFMFAENERFIGKWELIDIGLHPDFIKTEETNYYALDEGMIKDIVQPRASFSHKGTFGHVCICAGSKGKVGASILSAKAALRTGCGLLTLHVPSSAALEIHSQFPEAMVEADENENFLSSPVKNISNFHAVGFGPGVDKHKETGNVLKLLIQNMAQPLVIDADGLNLLAENKTWMQFLNGNTILTPHPGEFDRLTVKHSNGVERWKTLMDFSKKYGVYVVLKGHHTSITTPGGLSFFNTTGNSGMATAGSGDVLTGMITSLCAQGYSSLHAALLGVYAHGYAGDLAANELSETSMIASDIIDQIPHFFKAFEK